MCAAAPQVLQLRMRFRLERAASDSSLIDCTGRTLKMEPLVTGRQLERYLLKQVSQSSESAFRRLGVVGNTVQWPGVVCL